MDEFKNKICKLIGHEYKFLTQTADKQFDVYVCERCGKQIFAARTRKPKRRDEK